MVTRQPTFIVGLISVLHTQIIALDVQFYKWMDQLLFDKLPDDSEKKVKK